ERSLTVAAPIRAATVRERFPRGRRATPSRRRGHFRSSLYVVDFAVDKDDLHILIEVSLLLTQIGDPNRVAHASDYVCNALAHLDGDWPGGSWRGCNWPGLSEHILLLPVGLLCLLSQLIGGVRLGGRQIRRIGRRRLRPHRHLDGRQP